MNNLDHTQTAAGSEVAAHDGSVDGGAAVIPPIGAVKNLNEDEDLWNWVINVRPEEFPPEVLNYPTLQKPPEFWKSANPLPPELIKPNAAKFNSISPELRSLILWQAENFGYKGPAAPRTVVPGPVGGDATAKNKKRKEIEVDDNYESNARVPRSRGGSRTSQLIEYHTSRPGRKSNYSINDKLMALQGLIPGSQKADMATTLSETLEYLTQVKLREAQLQEEVKQLRQAIGLITGMHPSVQKYMQSPRGTPLYMGMNTQLRGMEYRPTVHPTMKILNSSMSAGMNKPSVVPLLSQQNSAAASSRLFVPPQVPAPSQQQGIALDHQALHHGLFVLNEVVMKDICTQENVTSTGDTKIPDSHENQPQSEDTEGAVTTTEIVA